MTMAGSSRRKHTAKWPTRLCRQGGALMPPYKPSQPACPARFHVAFLQVSSILTP